MSKQVPKDIFEEFLVTITPKHVYAVNLAQGKNFISAPL